MGHAGGRHGGDRDGPGLGTDAGPGKGSHAGQLLRHRGTHGRGAGGGGKADSHGHRRQRHQRRRHGHALRPGGRFPGRSEQSPDGQRRGTGKGRLSGPERAAPGGNSGDLRRDQSPFGAGGGHGGLRPAKGRNPGAHAPAGGGHGPLRPGAGPGGLSGLRHGRGRRGGRRGLRPGRRAGGQTGAGDRRGAGRGGL